MKKETKKGVSAKKTMLQSAAKRERTTGSPKGRAAQGENRVRKVSAVQLTKVSAEHGTQVALTGELFSGAKSIELTAKGITVTHEAKRAKGGAVEKVELRRKLPNTPETLYAANAALRGGKFKKVRIEF